MRALIIYESYYGNTKAVADTIFKELESKGYDVEIHNIRESIHLPLQADLLFIGSPVRIGSFTGRIKHFVKRIDVNEWKYKTIIFFSTILKLPENATEEQKENQKKWDFGASWKMANLAKSRGLNVSDQHLWIEVEGMKGPLVKSGLGETISFVRNTISSII